MDQVSLFSDLCGWTFQLPLVLAWESPQVINVSERATPFSLSPCPSASPQLTLHLLCLLPLPFPQSFSTYHAIGGLGVCGPDVFPKRLEDYFFKSLHRADVPLQLPLPRPAIAETFLCPREHMVWLLCVWSGEPEQNKRIPHWWLFGRQASRCVCVCSSSLCSYLSCEQMFSTGWVAVLSLVPDTSASSCSPASGHSVCPTLASFLACIHLSLLHPELCALSLGNLLEK